MRHNVPSAVEIDRKLRDDFRRRVKDFGISAELTDPVLAVLFRTFAQQLEKLYSETDRIRSAMLDELIANLGIEPRMAFPAQTLVRFLLDQGSQVIGAGTELFGEAQTGERLTFMTDATIAVSEARIAFALAYEEGGLRLLQSVEMPEALQAARPSLERVNANLGPNPALFLAIENLPGDHLSQHALFFDLGPDAYFVEEALKSETWCLINNAGELSGTGILRPRPGNAGIRRLQWLVSPLAAANGEPASTDDEVAALPDGFYGPRTFLFPRVSSDRRFCCRIPRSMEGPLVRIFGRESQRALSAERAWIRISMPAGIPALHTALAGITLHGVTASNVECFNETITFTKHGTSIPILREQGGAAQHLVAPLSIFGEEGTPYIREAEPSNRFGTGRYAIRNGRIDLTPARHADGSAESYANLRLWVTQGSLGNKVDPGKVTGFLKANQIRGLRLANPTAATGGSDGEELSKAENRFANALLSRDRIVSRADLINAVRAFDHRIADAEVQPAVRRSEYGLQRVDRVQVSLTREDFIDPETEFPRLKGDLLRHLAERFPLGCEVAVEVLTL